MSQKELVQSIMPKIKQWASVAEHKYRLEHGELLGLAWEAAYKAANNFDPSKGYKFATFAEHRVRGMIKDYIADLVKHRHQDIDNINKPHKPTSHNQILEVLEELEKNVSHRDFEMLKHKYMYGFNLSEIAEIFGLSSHRISVLINRAIGTINQRSDINELVF
jgi:RNA polymerase sigma factor (sigma-70 family)